MKALDVILFKTCRIHKVANNTELTLSSSTFAVNTCFKISESSL